MLDPSSTRADFANQQLTCHEAKQLAKELASNKSLTSLNLEGNQIGEAGATALEQTVRFENSTLTTLNLDGNPCCDSCPHVVTNINRLIQRNATLNASKTPRTARTPRNFPAAASASMTSSNDSISSTRSSSLMPPPPRPPVSTVSTVPHPPVPASAPTAAASAPVPVPTATVAATKGTGAPLAAPSVVEAGVAVRSGPAAGAGAGRQQQPGNGMIVTRLQQLEETSLQIRSHMQQLQELMASLSRDVGSSNNAPSGEPQEQWLGLLEAAVASKADQDTTEQRLQRLEDAAADALSGLLEIRQLAASISHRQMHHILEVDDRMGAAAAERAELRQRLDRMEQQQHDGSMCRGLEARLVALEQSQGNSSGQSANHTNDGRDSTHNANSDQSPPARNQGQAGPPTPPDTAHQQRFASLSPPPSNLCAIHSEDGGEVDSSPEGAQSVCTTLEHGQAARGCLPNPSLAALSSAHRPHSSLVWYKNIAAASVAGSMATDAASADADDSPRVQVVSGVPERAMPGTSPLLVDTGEGHLSCALSDGPSEGASDSHPSPKDICRYRSHRSHAAASLMQSHEHHMHDSSASLEDQHRPRRLQQQPQVLNLDQQKQEGSDLRADQGFGGAAAPFDSGLMCSKATGGTEEQGRNSRTPKRSSIDVAHLLHSQSWMEGDQGDDAHQMDQTYTEEDQTAVHLSSPHLAGVPAAASLSRERSQKGVKASSKQWPSSPVRSPARSPAKQLTKPASPTSSTKQQKGRKSSCQSPSKPSPLKCASRGLFKQSSMGA